MKIWITALSFALFLGCGSTPPVADAAPDGDTGSSTQLFEIDLSGTDPEVAQLLRDLLTKARAEPQAGYARGALGMACEINGLTRDAITYYRQAIQLEPGEPRWSYFLAQTQARQGDVEQALQSLQPVLDAAPDYLSAWLYRGQWQMDLGQLENARAAYTRAIALDPTEAAASIGMARVLLREERPAEAVSLLLRLKEITATGSYFNQLLGLAYRDAGQMEQARQYLTSGTPGPAPGWPDPWHDRKATYQVGFGAGMVRAETLMDRGLMAEAITVLEPLREQQPDDVALLNNLSVAYRRVGQEDRSFQVLVDGLQRHPDYHPFHLNISAAYQRQGDLTKALEHLDRAVEISPNLAEAHDRRGRLLIGQRRLAEALQAFDRALENDANRPATLTTAGVLEAELKNWSRAILRTEQSLLLDPNQLGALIVLGRARAELGEFDAAQQALDRAARIQPNNRTLQSTRTRLEQLRTGAR